MDRSIVVLHSLVAKWFAGERLTPDEQQQLAEHAEYMPKETRLLEGLRRADPEFAVSPADAGAALKADLADAFSLIERSEAVINEARLEFDTASVAPLRVIHDACKPLLDLARWAIVALVRSEMRRAAAEGTHRIRSRRGGHASTESRRKKSKRRRTAFVAKLLKLHDSHPDAKPRQLAQHYAREHEKRRWSTATDYERKVILDRLEQRVRRANPKK